MKHLKSFKIFEGGYISPKLMDRKGPEFNW